MILIAIHNQERDQAKLFDVPAAKTALPALVRIAGDALRAGVSLSLSDYAELSTVERRAFALAGDRIRAQDAQLAGVANSGLMGAALATVDYDDGEAAELLSLETAHAAAVAAANGGS